MTGLVVRTAVVRVGTAIAIGVPAAPTVCRSVIHIAYSPDGYECSPRGYGLSKLLFSF